MLSLLCALAAEFEGKKHVLRITPNPSNPSKQVYMATASAEDAHAWKAAFDTFRYPQVQAQLGGLSALKREWRAAPLLDSCSVIH